MTVTANVQKLVDGPRNYVVRLSATMANTDSESLVKKVDITTLSSDSGSGPLAQAPMRLKLLRTVYSTQNLIVTLFWGGTPNLLFEVLPPNHMGVKEHFMYGGIEDSASSYTGNVFLTTESFGSSISDAQYDVTLFFCKKYS
jgi:hypothetical protein